MISRSASSSSDSIKDDRQPNTKDKSKTKGSARPPRPLAPLVILLNTSDTRYHVIRDAALEMPGWAVEDDGRKDVPKKYWKESDYNLVRESRKKGAVAAHSSRVSSAREKSANPSPPPKLAGKRSNSVAINRRIVGSGKRPTQSENEQDLEDECLSEDGDATLWSDEPHLSNHSKHHFSAKKAKEAQLSQRLKPFSSTSTGIDEQRDDLEGGLGMTKRQEDYVMKKHSITSGNAYDAAKHCSIFWTDLSVLPTRVSTLKCWQRLNHFPDMHLIARKVNLFQRLCKVAKTYEHVFPKSFFDFFPLSWSSKSERKQLEDYMAGLQLKNKVKTFLMKPNTGCQGRGIILTRNPIAEMTNVKSRNASSFTGGSRNSQPQETTQPSSSYDPLRDYTIQLYVHKPLLIEGRKFDMRVYVLILSLNNPCPHIFVHKQGLVRIAGQPYQKPTPANYKKATMHLTNYAVNKKEVNQSLESGEANANDLNADLGDVGLKRDFAFLETFVDKNCRRWVDSGSNEDSNEETEQAENLSEMPSLKRDEDINSPPMCDGISPYHALLQRIDRAVVLTVLSALPQLQQAMQGCSVGYLTPQNALNATTIQNPKSKVSDVADGRQCFELLGFDILVTDSGRIRVLEVNHSPSLFCDAAIDQRIKQKVIKDVFTLVHPTIMDVSKTSSRANPSAEEKYAKHIDPSNRKTAVKIAKSFQKIEFRQVHPVPNSISDSEVEQGYHNGAAPFLLHRPITSPALSLKATSPASPFSDSSIKCRIAEMEANAQKTATLFRCYDPNAQSIPKDPCYQLKDYALWCRHMYDTVMVSTGISTGFPAPV